MMRDIEAFDHEHAQALRAMWFLGDVHAEFRHIVTANPAQTRFPAGWSFWVTSRLITNPSARFWRL